jgi:CBS domain-containing protein
MLHNIVELLQSTSAGKGDPDVFSSRVRVAVGLHRARLSIIWGLGVLKAHHPWRCRVEQLRVRDLMVPISEYATVSEEATLHDAVVALEEADKSFGGRKYKHRSVLVVRPDKSVVGRLTYLGILQALEPKYEKLGDISGAKRFGLSPEFITFMMKHFGLWTGSFQDLCAVAAARKVKDLVTTPPENLYVNRDAALNEALHRLIISQELSLLVTGDRGEVVGVLRLIDLFDKVSEQIRACDS